MLGSIILEHDIILKLEISKSAITALAALLSVAVGLPVTPNCALNSALLYSGQVLPAPLLPLHGATHGITAQLPVQQTPVVAQATAEFMASWNAAAERATKIQTTLVKSATPSTPLTIIVPEQVQQTDEVRRATAEFMAAWNTAAQRATAVEVGMAFGAPKSVKFTPEVQRATAEFMTSWHNAAERAAAVRAAFNPATIYAAGSPLQLRQTEEVRKATAEFMRSWQEAAARVPKIQTSMYHLSGIPAAAPVHAIPQPVKFTAEVEKATAEFMGAFNKAATLAAATPVQEIAKLPAVKYSAPVASETYEGPMASGIIMPSGYTKEVDEARRDFQRVFDAAASRAAMIIPVVPSVRTMPLAPAAPVVTLAKPAAPAKPEVRMQPAPVAKAPQATQEKAAEPTLKAAEPAPKAAVEVEEPAPKYTGPFASGIITDSGFTKEVEAARREFMTAFQEAAARAPETQETPSQRRAPEAAAPAAPKAAAPAAPEAAAPAARATPAKPRYTGPYASGVIAPSGYTIEVEQARKEFLATYKKAAALAAKTPDYSAVTYTVPAPSPALAVAPLPTPEVARSTAEFMAAWNAAAARAATIEAKLVRFSPTPSTAAIVIPKQRDTTQEVKKATEEFMAAWNAAARRVTTVQQAVTLASPKPVKPTDEVERATAEFMAAWQAAARRAPKIEQAIVKAASQPAGEPKQVEATAEVQKATAEFMAAWNAAAARVPKIENIMYSAIQPAAVSVGGNQHFIDLFRSAQQTAVLPSAPMGTLPFGVNLAFANQVGTNIAYAGTTASFPETVATLKSFPLSHRLFAPVQGLPVFYDSKCYSKAKNVLRLIAQYFNYKNSAIITKSYNLLVRLHLERRKNITGNHKIYQALAALLSVAVGLPVTPNCALNSALLYSGQVLPAPILPLHGATHGITAQLPVQQTPAVAQATAEFMASWNAAAERATKIQTTLVKSATPSTPLTIIVPEQVQQTDEVRRATAEFMAAWNTAAQRATAVEVGMAFGAPKSVKFTPEVQRATAEFMTSWHNAAQRAAAVRAAFNPATIYAAGSPLQLRQTEEVMKATADFMRSWQEAAARVPKIQTSMYHLSGIPAAAPVHAIPQPVKFTAEVEKATAEFMGAFNKAATLAAATPAQEIAKLPAVKYSAPIASETYEGPMASGIIMPSGYTKEVDEARRDFQRVFDAAATRAAMIIPVVPSIRAMPLAPAAPVVTLAKPAAPAKPEVRMQPAPVAKAPQATQEKAAEPALKAAEPAPKAAVEVEEPAPKYSGPFASGIITDSGFTKEVEAARREFMTAFQEAAARAPETQETPSQRRAPEAAAPAAPKAAAPAAPEAAAPAARATPAKPRYTGPYASGVIAPSGYTIEVEQARKEFLATYKKAAALAAKTPDYSAVTYTVPAPSPALAVAPLPTPEVARSTAEFMAAWNAAAARAATIEAKLVRFSPTPSTAAIVIPKQRDTTQEVKKATEEFMAAWNAAARRVTTVQQAVTLASPKPVQPTDEVERATAEFMAAWQAAARRAPKIEQAIVKAASQPAGEPKQVEATAEVQKATAEFMAAWNAAAARVPKIENIMYSAIQPAAVSVGGNQHFMDLFRSAQQTAVLPSAPMGTLPFGVNLAFANQVGTNIAYAGTTASFPETVATLKSFPLSHRLFAPVQGLPVFYDSKCA
ncbi:uncharacterized protein LOC143032628 [Oratosquilla oratoria]|uniref:uncharacterized protein LOC143032628 n=1 Tax=Oratosquilla oratoria TaxID=337810 RepID=UPI003F75AAE5